MLFKKEKKIEIVFIKIYNDCFKLNICTGGSIFIIIVDLVGEHIK